jgi:hypothetical protein
MILACASCAPASVPLSGGDELRGLPALSAELGTDEPDGIPGEVLADYLAADVHAATWRSWLRAFGRLRPLP